MLKEMSKKKRIITDQYIESNTDVIQLFVNYTKLGVNHDGHSTIILEISIGLRRTSGTKYDPLIITNSAETQFPSIIIWYKSGNNNTTFSVGRIAGQNNFPRL